MRRPIDLEQLRCRAEHLVRRALELPRELLGRLEAHRAEHQETARRLESLQRDAARLDSRLDGRHQHQERLERRLAELDAHRDRLLALDELRPLAPLVEFLVADAEADTVQTIVIDSRAPGATTPSVMDDPRWKAAWERRRVALRKLGGR